MAAANRRVSEPVKRLKKRPEPPDSGTGSTSPPVGSTERLKLEVGDDAKAQIALGFRLAYGREPRGVEIGPCHDFVAKSGLAAFCRVLFNANEFLYVN